MYEYKVGDLARVLSGLLASSRDLATADSLSQTICDNTFCNDVVTLLDALSIVSGNFHADSSLIEQINDLQLSVRSGANRKEAVLHARLDTILTGVQNNLESRKFMFMSTEESPYWNNPHLFGKEFIQQFPKNAALEMMDAGNCYATSLGTACVFHCIRVAEYGLRKLAKKVRVTLTDRGKKQPLEYAEWQKIIDSINNKLKVAHQHSKGPRREATLQFYSDAADHCLYMKDIVRNEISHARRRYNQAETLGIFNRVRDFVQLLCRSSQ